MNLISQTFSKIFNLDLILTLANRIASGFLGISVIVVAQQYYGDSFASQLVFSAGLAAVLYSFVQGVMPVSFARRVGLGDDPLQLMWCDLIPALVGGNALLIGMMGFGFNLLNIQNYIQAGHIFLVNSYIIYWTIAKLWLNTETINRYLFAQVALPPLVILSVILTYSIFGIVTTLFSVGLSSLGISLVFLFWVIKVLPKKFAGLLDIRERLLRLCLTLIEFSDIAILFLVGAKEFVIFSIVKRLLSIGGIFSSIITKTYEKELVFATSSSQVIWHNILRLAALQAIFCIAFWLWMRVFSDLSIDVYIMAAGVISILLILNSSKIVLVLNSDSRTWRAIVSIILFSSSVIGLVYYLPIETINKCLSIYLLLYLVRVSVLYRYSS